MTKKKTTEAHASGTILSIPLCKLKKSPCNARKMPHPKADIEALAASIAANGMLQNPVVEPETEKGKPTGFYLVTIGEGRRQAQLLRVKRKEIKKSEPVRCMLDTAHNAFEISLAENAVRSPMHPADQFDAFHQLHRDHGQSAEDIAARFGVTPAVVRQRLKLAAVSPALIDAYRESDMNLDQLTAFAITEDHAAQEAVWENLGPDAEREELLDALNAEHVPASDPRARFVGVEAYRNAGGAILHDLFDQEGDGFFTDPALLAQLVAKELNRLADIHKAEGWKWVETMVRYDYAHAANMRRMQPVLSSENQTARDALEAEFDALDIDADDYDAESERLQEAIDALEGQAIYDLKDMARAGVIIAINQDGTPRIERWLVRPEDIVRETKPGTRPTRTEGPAPLSDKLVAELTACRTMVLRDALSQNPAVALTALVHAVALRAFFHGGSDETCLDVTFRNPPVTQHAPGIQDSAEARALEERHQAWAQRLPEDPAALWEAVSTMRMDDQLALLAHGTALSVNAVQTRDGETDNAQRLAQALSLDMAAHWQPNAANYFGRVSKERILEAVREAASPEAASSIASLKKGAMAEAAALRLKDKGWLPPILRTPQPLAIAAE